MTGSGQYHKILHVGPLWLTESVSYLEIILFSLQMERGGW